MMVDLEKLIQNTESSVDINEIITFDPTTLKNAGIINMNPVSVKGIVTKNAVDVYHLCLNINGIMILPCSLTLVDVEYPFDINYEGDTNEEENLKIIGNYLDIIPIIWENIVTEIPLRVISSDTKLEETKTKDFKIITDDIKKENQFEILKDLLKEKEDE